LRIFLLLFLLLATSLIRSPELTLASSGSSGQTLYDEQLALSFTQSFQELSYNVTAVSQCGTDGIGVGYLVNGLTDVGNWYQVGLSWRWPILTNSSVYPTRPGFDSIYEVFSTNGSSLHIGGKGPILKPLSVNPGDLVLLRMGFSLSNVTMYVYDWSTGASSQTSYNAFGARSFVPAGNAPVDHNGFFTGLMTEQYHSGPYYGDERQAIYSESGFGVSSAWMWADEFRVPFNQYSEFYQSYLASYSNPQQMVNFTSNGAFESSNSTSFITGRSTSGFACPQSPWLVIFQRYWYFIPIWFAIVVGGLLVALFMMRRSRDYTGLPSSSSPPSWGQQFFSRLRSSNYSRRYGTSLLD
jgi:hypothetical protein